MIFVFNYSNLKVFQLGGATLFLAGEYNTYSYFDIEWYE